MGTQAQGQQGQVYYDDATGQYYTQPTQQGGNFFNPVFGLMKNNSQRNYLQNMNNQSMVDKPRAPHNYIDIAALFPELMQGAQGMQGDYQAGNLLGGAAQSASSGAGRFL